MDYFVPLIFLPLCILFSTIWFLASLLRDRRRQPNLPPGPPPVPIIGNILQLGKNPHQSLAKLSKTYGPIMHLKLGTIHTIVVSSPQLAKQVLQTQDQLLSGRLPPASSSAFAHDKVSLLWLPVGTQWRLLRKISKEHMFSLQRLDASRDLRRVKLRKLQEHVSECCERGEVLDIADVAFATSLSLIWTSLFSVDFAEFGSAKELKGIVHGLMNITGTPNLGDYFPFLKAFDLQGLRHRAEYYVGELFRIFDDVIQQRLRLESGSESRNDLLEALLDISCKNESGLSQNDMMHLLMDLLIGGTDTTATTVEWAMAELMRNPKKMERARNELRTIIGQDQQIEESDITRLPYLQGVLKETFRLHPVGPMLVPHKAESDTEINGYTVPRNAQISVNIWAIGRDSSVWSNPDCFEPERFLESKMDIRGQDFELIPFGSGRRICAGLPLAYRMVHMMVATLVHDFDWKLEGGIKAEELDMNEKFEFALQKAVSLKAIPVKL